MSEHMDHPPVDHGSDRYDYIEVEAPPGIAPTGDWYRQLVAWDGCGDCRANIFLRYLDTEHPGDPSDVSSWHITVAHDDACPFLARMEREGR